MVGASTHETRRSHLGGEAPAFVERDDVGLADQFDTVDVDDFRMREHGIDQHSATPRWRKSGATITSRTTAR